MKRYGTIALLFLAFSFCLAGVSLASPLHDAQISLAQLGYNPGPPDGKMGRQTGEALRQFQRDNHLPITGQADPQTMDMLRKKSSRPGPKAQVAPQPSPAPAVSHRNPAPAPAPSHQNMSVADMQRSLSALGYNPGPPDGKMGGHTISALKQFQRDNHLPVTGRLDNQTRSLLQRKGPRR